MQKGIITLRNSTENQRNAQGGNGVFDIRQEGQRAAFEANDRALNRVADQLQVLELVTRDSRKEEAAHGPPSEGVVVTYQLHTRTKLPSRSDRQLIQVDELAMKGTFYKVAIPVLTSYVYDEAELINSSASVLLAGPVASYVDGQFVGNGTIDTVAVGQAFKVGLGIDASLQAARERMEKSEQTQGGNRIVNFAYRLAVENFGTKAATVRLMDRLPVGKEGEVRVTFDNGKGAPLSADKEY